MKNFPTVSSRSWSTWERVSKPRSGVGWQQWLGGPPVKAPFRKAFTPVFQEIKLPLLCSPSSVFAGVTVWVIEKLIGVPSFWLPYTLPQKEWEGRVFSPLSKSHISSATQSMVRGPVASPRSLLEMYFLRLYLRSAEAESPRWRPAICVLIKSPGEFYELWSSRRSRGGRRTLLCFEPTQSVFSGFSQKEEGRWPMTPISKKCPSGWQNLWGEALGTPEDRSPNVWPWEWPWRSWLLTLAWKVWTLPPELSGYLCASGRGPWASLEDATKNGKSEVPPIQGSRTVSALR